jgi:hypothetical protein
LARSMCLRLAGDWCDATSSCQTVAGYGLNREGHRPASAQNGNKSVLSRTRAQSIKTAARPYGREGQHVAFERVRFPGAQERGSV